MAAITRLGAVSLDCPAHALAQFYAGMLGAEVAYDSETFCAVALDNIWLSTVQIHDHRPASRPSSPTSHAGLVRSGRPPAGRREGPKK
jgi:hypothetical protein